MISLDTKLASQALVNFQMPGLAQLVPAGEAASAEVLAPGEPAISRDWLHNMRSAFEEFDVADEQQIIMEMNGLLVAEVERFVYAFCSNKGRDHKKKDLRGHPLCCPMNFWIVELSYFGIKEAARVQKLSAYLATVQQKRGRALLVDTFALEGDVPTFKGKQLIESEELLNVPDYVEAYAWSRDPETGIIRPGVAKQLLREYDYEGGQRQQSNRDDPFAVQKGISKAVRNALRVQIPETLARVWIKRFLGLPEGATVRTGNIDESGDREEKKPQNTSKQGSGSRPPAAQKKPVPPVSPVIDQKARSPRGRLIDLFANTYGNSEAKQRTALEKLSRLVTYRHELADQSKKISSFAQVTPEIAKEMLDALEEGLVKMPTVE